MKVLVAEDDAMSRRILEAAVEKCGHSYLSAANGLDAWELLRKNPVDVVISDWMMPGIDGIELCKRVRQQMQTETSYVYFIFLSALDEKDRILEAMEAEADDYLTKPLDRTDLRTRLNVAQRVTSLYRLLAEQRTELGRQYAEVERLNSILFDQARTDPLTQVGNRLRMREDLEGFFSHAERYGHTFALLLLDVDSFKLYNDTYGHPAGDMILRAVADKIREIGRLGDTVYRYGGEEFLVVLPEQTIQTAAIAAERLRRAIEHTAIPHEAKDPPGVVTISVGVSGLWDVGQDDRRLSIAAVLQQADEALYRAKRSGRNRVVLYQDNQAAAP